MHTSIDEQLLKDIGNLPTEVTLQHKKGKRAQAFKHPNPKPAQKQGRHVPRMIHSSELDEMSAEIEAQFLADISRLDKKTRLIRRAYIPGEAHPLVMPNENNRTTVEITAKQRVYKVDGKPVLYVDLRHRMTDEEKAAKLEFEADRRAAKIPGGAKGKRPFQVVREVIMEREI